MLIAGTEARCFVTGVDKSKPMLARCRTKANALPSDARDRITLAEAEMTDFQLSRTFKLAIVPFRPLQHLLRKIAAALAAVFFAHASALSIPSVTN
ncbi:MAG: hypothetical protein JO138_11900 [Acidobacteriaceae bacterium]|nr:hypothetical protein [Acidobacteriaceae bacterium]